MRRLTGVLAIALVAAMALAVPADAGKRTKRVIKGAVVGAAVGSLLGGKDGARSGAAIGAISGAVRN